MKLQADVSEGAHRYYRFRFDGEFVGKIPFSTPIPKDISDNMMAQLARELHLENRRELESYCDCSKSAEEWRQHLEQWWRENRQR